MNLCLICEGVFPRPFFWMDQVLNHNPDLFPWVNAPSLLRVLTKLCLHPSQWSWTVHVPPNQPNVLWWRGPYRQSQLYALGLSSLPGEQPGLSTHWLKELWTCHRFCKCWRALFKKGSCAKVTEKKWMWTSRPDECQCKQRNSMSLKRSAYPCFQEVGSLTGWWAKTWVMDPSSRGCLSFLLHGYSLVVTFPKSEGERWRGRGTLAFPAPPGLV